MRVLLAVFQGHKSEASLSLLPPTTFQLPGGNFSRAAGTGPGSPSHPDVLAITKLPRGQPLEPRRGRGRLIQRLAGSVENEARRSSFPRRTIEKNRRLHLHLHLHCVNFGRQTRNPAARRDRRHSHGIFRRCRISGSADFRVAWHCIESKGELAQVCSTGDRASTKISSRLFVL